MTIIIEGETPAKKNSRITIRKTGRSIPSKRYRDWHTRALQSLPKDCKTIEDSCEISLHFIHGDLRRRDSDNGTSSIIDLLVDAKILKDDNWQIVKKINITNTYAKNDAKCIVEINEI